MGEPNRCVGPMLTETKACSPLLVDARSAAKMLCVSERTLWSLSDRGQLASVRIGRRRLYDPRDLKAFVDRRKSPEVMTLAL